MSAIRVVESIQANVMRIKEAAARDGQSIEAWLDEAAAAHLAASDARAAGLPTERARFLSAISERDCTIARLRRNAELSGRAIDRCLESLHSTTRGEPPRTEMVWDRLVRR